MTCTEFQPCASCSPTGSAGRLCELAETELPAASSHSYIAPSICRSVDSIKKPSVHVVYDVEYQDQSLWPDLCDPLRRLGFDVAVSVMTKDNIDEVVSSIADDAVVFLHCDLPVRLPVGSQHTALREFVKRCTRNKVAGFRPEYGELCTWKSTMATAMQKHNVPHAATIRISEVSELLDSNVCQQLEAMPKPCFIKIDDGSNSDGLTDSSVAPTTAKLTTSVQEFVKQYGPVTVQPFLPGREFTIAVATVRNSFVTRTGLVNGYHSQDVQGRADDDHVIAFHPVERVFADGQLFSPANGTRAERMVDGDAEPELVLECKRVAEQAYRSVGGSCYGRVDLRCDANGKVFVLEVNNTCSFAPNSYFEMSCLYEHVSREDILREQIERAR